MGLFGKKKSRQERGMEIANKVASGKGFYGRVTKAFVGQEDFAKIQNSVGAINTGLGVQELLAMGVPTYPATLVSIVDTGTQINHDPLVDLVVELQGGGGQLAIQTIVSKIHIPRPGDRVLVLPNPQQPGTYLYAGLAP